MTEVLTTKHVTFVANVNDKLVFEKNLMISPCFNTPHPHQLVLQKNFDSAAKAYNDALSKSVNDLVVFAHQDIIFPSGWLSQLEDSIRLLATKDPNWGVLGIFGKTSNGEEAGYVYSTGLGIIGDQLEGPKQVQTLDEIVLILRKSSGLKFDERLPHFHFYGADICLAAQKKGMQSYAIPAFCIHNTQFNLVMPSEFYASYTALKTIWKEYVPVHTTCIRVTKFNLDVYRRRLNEINLRLRRKTVGALRQEDSYRLLREFEKPDANPSTES
jgi:hypothetical protein